MLKILPRSIDQEHYKRLLQSSIHPVVARVLAGRAKPLLQREVKAFIEPKLSHLDSPFLMKDMPQAVTRIIQAIKAKEIIAIETDHDCDGQTSHAVMVTALTTILAVDPACIQSFIGHRMQEGYGLSEALAKRILASNPRPSLVITADNGSADEPRIALLKSEGIEVIVTDHHALPQEGPPKSAYACLNPTRKDCQFPDPYIAGCMVAWLLMAAVRRQMIDQGDLPATSPSMASLLDYVAVGTIADCVSMARSFNNRVVVHHGLKRINRWQRPCWQAIKPLLRTPEVRAEDLGFLIGPLLNSDGRLSDAFGSVNFLLSNHLSEASPWAQALYQQNTKRKAIQKELTAQAMVQAKAQVAAKKCSLVMYLEDGHAGVHGISASRIKDAFGRPTIIFSPKLGESEIISGSARSIEGLNIHQALQWVDAHAPGVLVKYGGHTGAAGLTLKKVNLALFAEAFEQAVLEQITPEKVGPVIWTDGTLEEHELDLQLAEAIATLEPFGREFETPVFEGHFVLERLRMVGQGQNHAQLWLTLPQGKSVKAIWFNACEPQEPFALEEQQQLHCAYQLSPCEFNGSRRLELQVLAAHAL